MRKSVITVAAVAMMGFGASAVADESSVTEVGASAVADENSVAVMLTDAQMDAVVAGHPLNPPGNDKTISIGGPLGSPEPGNGAQGHWRGIDCNAAAAPAPITPLGICVR